MPIIIVMKKHLGFAGFIYSPIRHILQDFISFISYYVSLFKAYRNDFVFPWNKKSVFYSLLVYVFSIYFSFLLILLRIPLTERFCWWVIWFIDLYSIIENMRNYYELHNTFYLFTIFKVKLILFIFHSDSLSILAIELSIFDFLI